MSTSSSPILPLTPVRKRATTPSRAELRHDAFVLSAMSSPGNTLNGGSFPATPLSSDKFPINKPQARRRGNTISTITEASLMHHAIFTLSSNAPGPKKLTRDCGGERDVYTSELDSQTSLTSMQHDERIYMSHLQGDAEECPPNTTEAKDTRGSETSRYAELDESILESKDLAQSGLPSACIFVANLAANQTDDQLVRNLKEHFSQFGRVYVKIRRDGKGNPFSFCQFETDEAARTAIRVGRNAIVDSSGRPIRCEPAKVNRTLAISRQDGLMFSEDEVQQDLDRFGGTESLEFTTSMNSQPVRGLKEGRRCFVRFIYRQDAVDCYQFFRFHDRWITEWTNNFSAPENVPRIRTVQTDSLSIFVGKLNPRKVTELELLQRFGEHGNIQDYSLFDKKSYRTAFAFIRYSSEEEATAAIQSEHGSSFLGGLIHVQRREIHRKYNRRAFSPEQGTQGQTRNKDGTHCGCSVHCLRAVPSFPFPLKDIADLAARLGMEIAIKHRLPSHHATNSIVPDAGFSATPGLFPFSFSTEPFSSGRPSSVNNTASAPGFPFLQSLQANQGLHGSTTSESPLSRAVHAALSARVGFRHAHGERAEKIISGPYGRPPIPGFLNPPIRHGGKDQLWGEFPPRYVQSQIQMTDPYQRDSTPSMGYEVHMGYAGHGDGLISHPIMRRDMR